MPMQIPKEYRQAVERLIKLDEDSVDSLLVALKAADPAISPRSLARAIASDVPIDIGPLTDLLTALISLILSVTGSKSSDQDPGMEVAQAAAKAELGDMEPGSEAESRFAARVARFLELADKLYITSKASSVYFAHQSLFQRSKILSDIRTIFGPGETIEPIAGMIVHQLEIVASEDNGVRSHYIAMNIHDLRELRRAIDRAIAKETALRKVISDSGLQFLEDAPTRHQR